VGAGGTDLLLGCDLVVAASPSALASIETGVTRAVINSHVQPTAAFVFNPDIDFEAAAMLRAIRTAVGEGGTDIVDGTGLASALIGDSIAANLFMLGYAAQKDLVPVSLDAIERAIELNGVAVDSNKRSFALGRLAAHDRVRVETLARPAGAGDTAPAPRDLAALVARRMALLTDYQDAAYAERYRATVAVIDAAEKTRVRGCTALAETVATNLFKLMAYKDEYEVARLYADGAFHEKLRRQFDGNFTLEYHLAPPLLAPRDPVTGELRKRTFGPWMIHAFRWLARLRRVRGTALDIFGRTQERRMERRLIEEYEGIVRELAALLNQENHALAVEIASLPGEMRGFGHVKRRNVERAKAREAELLAMLRRKVVAASAA
jgi:indolepyruvate ferredoxin oxidoreductase